jgi:hypothetical protein
MFKTEVSQKLEFNKLYNLWSEQSHFSRRRIRETELTDFMYRLSNLSPHLKQFLVFLFIH